MPGILQNVYLLAQSSSLTVPRGQALIFYREGNQGSDRSQNSLRASMCRRPERSPTSEGEPLRWQVGLGTEKEGPKPPFARHGTPGAPSWGARPTASVPPNNLSADFLKSREIFSAEVSVIRKCRFCAVHSPSRSAFYPRASEATIAPSGHAGCPAGAPTPSRVRPTLRTGVRGTLTGLRPGAPCASRPGPSPSWESPRRNVPTLL